MWNFSLAQTIMTVNNTKTEVAGLENFIFSRAAW